MTEKIPNGPFVIASEQPQQCDFCGKIEELRPYGPKGETVCFECAMKDEDAARRQFLKRLRARTSSTGGTP